MNRFLPSLWVLLLLLFLPMKAFAQTFTAATSNTTTVCAGNQVRIAYSASANFGAGNQIIVELSNAAGAFTSPVVLNTANTTAASGNYNVTIPAATAGSNFYRIRVSSTNPANTFLVGTIFTIVSQAQCSCPDQFKIDWQGSYGGNATDNFSVVVPTSDGGYLLGGHSNSNANTGNKTSPAYSDSLSYWLVKVDADGTKLWDSTYGGILTDQLLKIIPTPDGGYLLCGFSQSPQNTGNKTSTRQGAASTDYWVIKINANGVKQWEQSYGGDQTQILFDVVPTADGGYLLAGQSFSPVSGTKTAPHRENGDYWLVKIDDNGNQLWDSSYGGSNIDQLRSIAATPDGGFLLAGRSSSLIGGTKTVAPNMGGVFDYYVVKINADGVQQWDNRYGGTGADNLSQIIPTTDGNYLLVGHSASAAATGQKTAPNRGGTDIWVVKIDGSGTQLWDSTYGGAGAEINTSVVPSRDGGFYIAAQSASGATGNKTLTSFGDNDLWVLKIDGNGALKEQYAYGSSAEDRLNNNEQIWPTADGGFIIGGTSAGGLTGNKTVPANAGDDYWIIKVSPSILISATARTSTACAGDELTIDYSTSCGTFNAGNNIRIELSNAAGSFASPTLLNTAATTANSGSYNVTIPAATAGGEFYRIRVISSNPVDTVVIGKLFTIVPPALCNCTEQYKNDWQLTLGGRTAERFNDIIPTADGNFLLFGSSQSPGGTGNKTLPPFGAFDYWIVKVNPAGAILAEYNYGGSNSESGGCIIPTPDGGYLLGGFTESVTGSGNQTAVAYGRDDYWIIKFDANGIVQWDQSYGGNLDDELHAMVPTADGGYLLAGQSVSLPSGNKTSQRFGTSVDYWLVKTDANGNILWQDTYGGIFQDSLRDVIALPDGGFLLGGTSNSGVSGKKTKPSNSGSVDYYIVKIDANGNQIWDSVYGGSARDVFSKFVPTTDGGFLLVGISNSGVSAQKTSPNYGGNDIWVVKIDANGVQQWDSTYGGSTAEGGNCIVPAGDGGFYLGGISNSPASGNKTLPGFGGNDFWLIKINENGIKTGEYVFGGTGNDGLFAIQPTSDGGLLLGGQSTSGISGNKTTPNFEAPFTDYWVIKLSPDIAFSATARTTTVCAGNALTIDYANTSCATFNAGNNIRIELSNAAGSFASPVLLNTAATTANSGSYNVTIPEATPGGEFYKIRVISSNPVDTVVIGKLFTVVPSALCNCSNDLISIWQRSFGGTGLEDPQVILPTPDGGYLFGGASPSPSDGNKTAPNNGSGDFWLVKTDALGVIQWDSSYGGAGSEILRTIIPAHDGGFILGGQTATVAASGNLSTPTFALNDYWIVKINTNGVIQWQQSFGGNANDDLYSIVPTPDGGYLLGGESNSNISGSKTAERFGQADYWVVKVDGNGNKLWDKAYGGDLNDNLRSIVPTSDGGYLLAGLSNSNASGLKSEGRNSSVVGQQDYWVVKIDANGNFLWDKTIGGEASDQLKSAIALADGNFLLVGNSSSPTPSAIGQKTAPYYGGSDIWAVKIDPSGNILWNNAYGGSGADEPFGAVQLGNGTIVINSFTFSPVSGNKTLANFGGNEAWLVFVDNDGNKVNESIWGGNGGDNGRALCTTADGGLLMLNQSLSSPTGNKTVPTNGGNDYWVVKLGGNVQLSATSRTTTICAGESLTVDYANIGCGNFASGNNIRIELSNAAGSFASPTLLNTAATTANSGSYTVTIPPATAGGEFYRVRVISSNPVDTVLIGEVFTIVPENLCNCTETLASFFQGSFGGTAADNLTITIPTPDGGYLLGGQSQSAIGGSKSSPAYGGDDIWVLKMDQAGNKVWDISFGGAGDDVLKTIFPTSDGGFLLGGSSNSAEGSGTKTSPAYVGLDYWLIKIDGNGNQLWEQSYGGSGTDILNAITAHPSGGFLLAGQSASPVSGTRSRTFGSTDYWLIRVDELGNQLWDSSYGGSGADLLFDIAATSDGGFLLAGQSASGASGVKTRNANFFLRSDFWVVKIDANGTQIWDSIYGGTDSDLLYKVIQVPDGGFILAGSSPSPASGQKSAPNRTGLDYWLVKINANGTKQWDQSYGGTGGDIFRDIVPTAAGKYIIGGRTISGVNGNKTIPSFGQNDFWILQINSAGDIEEQYVFGGSLNDELESIIPLRSGGFLLSGRSTSPINGNKTIDTEGSFDYWTIRLDFVPNITPVSTNTGTYCSGDSIQIEFDLTACGAFNPTNEFTYELSDGDGDFSSPTILGTAPNTTTRDTTLVLPISLPTGSGYRIRILASAPAKISDTTAAFSINGTPDLSAGITASCTAGLVLSVPDQGVGANYQWQDNNVNITSATQNTYAPLEQGIYRIIASRGSCRDTAGTYSITFASANQAQVFTMPDGAVRLICDNSSPVQVVTMKIDDDADGNQHVNTSTNMYVVGSAPVYNGQPYVRRYWDITPPAPKDKPVTVTFYVTQADFDDFNANAAWTPPLPTGPADQTGIDNLVVSIFHGNSATNLPATYNGRAEYRLSGVSVDVDWNPATNLWEITLPVDSFSGFFIHTLPRVLPVTLVQFTGTFNPDIPAVLLNWETSSEFNCDYFEVEKLMPNGSFQSLGTVGCSGTSNVPQYYSFPDKQYQIGSNIYRLKQVDYDGTFEYSRAIEVPVIVGTEFVYKAWTDQVFLYAEATERGQLEILDLKGSLIKSLQLEAGQRAQIYAANWPKGMYLMRFVNKDRQQAVRVVMQ